LSLFHKAFHFSSVSFQLALTLVPATL
jgi:hypothetical protein